MCQTTSSHAHHVIGYMLCFLHLYEMCYSFLICLAAWESFAPVLITIVLFCRTRVLTSHKLNLLGIVLIHGPLWVGYALINNLGMMHWWLTLVCYNLTEIWWIKWSYMLVLTSSYDFDKWLDYVQVFTTVRTELTSYSICGCLFILFSSSYLQR